MPINLARIKQKQMETRSGDGKNWKPKSKEFSNVRIYGFEHKVTKADVKAKLYEEKYLGEEVTEFERSFVTQFGICEDRRPVIATAKSLSYYEKLNMSESAEDKKLSEKCTPRTKYYMNVVDMDSPTPKMMVWAAPKTVVNYIYVKLNDPEYRESVLGPEGRDLRVFFDSDADGSKMYQIELRDEKKCKKIEADLKPIDFYTDEGIKQLAFGEMPSKFLDSVDDVEVDDDEKPMKKVVKKVEDPDDDPFVD